MGQVSHHPELVSLKTNHTGFLHLHSDANPHFRCLNLAHLFHSVRFSYLLHVCELISVYDDSLWRPFGSEDIASDYGPRPGLMGETFQA